ncbi:MAG: hypothetical protein Q7S27_06865 [Nanoarchaeota archaeon]|nr:hypothetical protein [Nanoarchaeota archaeon]
MLPKWHVLFGAILALIIWIAAPNTSILYILLFFFSSFLIDFDHYICAVLNTKKYSLGEAFEYHKEMDALDLKRRKKGIKEKGDFHLFHTIEFHILVGILGLYWVGFFYIFLGMMFHSLTDIYSLIYSSEVYRREFLLVNWIYGKIKNNN